MGKTLLLADDSVTIQKVVGISFASEDIAITTVDNGDDALIKAKELRPDAVLADVVMPGKSGYEVCEAIKADPELRHIPVLLLTGTFEAFDEERSRRVGAAGHVAKPFEAQTLVGRVKELLAQAPSAAPAAPEAAAPPTAAAPIPEASDASVDENSFDFFDDGSGAGAVPDTALDGATGDSALDESLSMDNSDAAFAFGDDDLAEPEPTPAPPEATVAILPDEMSPDAAAEPAVDPALAALQAAARGEPVGAPDANPPAPSADPALTVLDPAMAGGANEPPAAMPAPAEAAPADESFDFEFESGPSAAPASDAPAFAEDLGPASILDPELGADFAVSSSDLDSTLPPAPEAAPPAPEMPPPMPESQPEPQVAGFDAGVGDFLAAEPLEEVQPLEGPGGLVVPPAVEVGENEAIAAPEDAAAPPPMPETPAWTPPAAPAEPMAMPEPAPMADVAPPSEAAAPLAAEPLVEKIAPALRAELHETLEKIAWESLGPLTEKIVQEAIARLEKVAWDVVPKLAETLIQEEIRKLKGEVD